MLSRSGFKSTLLIITQLWSRQAGEEELQDETLLGRKSTRKKKSSLLEKSKHNFIPALFEVGTTCSLLKQLVWLFIILLLTLTYAHMKNCFMCCSEVFGECAFFYVVIFPMLKLCFKGFHYCWSYDEKCSIIYFGGYEVVLGNCLLLEWHFGEAGEGKCCNESLDKGFFHRECKNVNSLQSREKKKHKILHMTYDVII